VKYRTVIYAKDPRSMYSLTPVAHCIQLYSKMSLIKLTILGLCMCYFVGMYDQRILLLIMKTYKNVFTNVNFLKEALSNDYVLPLKLIELYATFHL
jgi:hypothetical protein